jgi:secreted trypsin-like serine protease
MERKKMATRTGNSRQHKAIVGAIKHAQTSAPKDDRAFLDAFRDHARSQIAAPAKSPARSIGLSVGRTPSATGPRLNDDPRYLANVRKLAQRTVKNARILGGNDVAAKEFDDCVAVGDDVQFGCTGTLIAPNVVLTAGHCEVLHTRIFVGNDTAKAGRVFRVKRYVRHPKWDSALTNDLMLLILEKSVTSVVPRKLATAAVIDNATDARVVGFGTTDTAGTKGYGTKQQTDVPIASLACSGRVKGRSDGVVYGCHAGKELVAGKPLLLHDTCRGDSGGPLYIADKQGQWMLAGVTSRGTDHASTMCGDGGIYTRVDKYRTWITAAMKSG